VFELLAGCLFAEASAACEQQRQKKVRNLLCVLLILPWRLLLSRQQSHLLFSSYCTVLYLCADAGVVCLFICMYVCMHVCVHACMYVHMYVCMHACLCLCEYVCISLSVCVSVRLCVSISVCIRLCLYTCMCGCVWLCVSLSLPPPHFLSLSLSLVPLGPTVSKKLDLAVPQHRGDSITDLLLRVVLAEGEILNLSAASEQQVCLRITCLTFTHNFMHACYMHCTLTFTHTCMSEHA